MGVFRRRYLEFYYKCRLLCQKIGYTGPRYSVILFKPQFLIQFLKILYLAVFITSGQKVS